MTSMWKVKCTQREFCGQAAFKNARTNYFWKLDGVGSNFRSGSWILNQFGGLAVAPIHLPMNACRGRFNVLHIYKRGTTFSSSLGL